MSFTPILSFLPRVRGKAAPPLGGEKVHRTFSGFRLAPHEGGRDVVVCGFIQSFPSCLFPHCVRFASDKEEPMSRKYIDCREYPSQINCTVTIFADSDMELLEAAVQHAVSVHGHEDTPDLREQLQKTFREERRRAA
jgi:predicted small metal-binding protein